MPTTPTNISVNESKILEFLARSWSIMNELQRFKIPVLPKSVPVLYFGNLGSYFSSPVRVITVALNPSSNEFPDGSPTKRFPGASAQSPEKHLSALNSYFDRNGEDLWPWFKHFDALLEGLETGFRPGRQSRAIHTDLCSPVATQPTYSRLSAGQQIELEGYGVPLWLELAELLDPDVIVMSGGVSLRDRVPIFANASWLRVFGKEAHDKKAVWTTELNTWRRQRLGVFGWTTQVPFGALSFSERKKVGALIKEKLVADETRRSKQNGTVKRRTSSSST